MLAQQRRAERSRAPTACLGHKELTVIGSPTSVPHTLTTDRPTTKKTRAFRPPCHYRTPDAQSRAAGPACKWAYGRDRQAAAKRPLGGVSPEFGIWLLLRARSTGEA